MPSLPYHHRALEQVFAVRASHQVAIMEGRRAVGKSSLARHLTEAGTYASYQSLTDPAAAERARRDALGWVRSLRRPAVIDEAQVVPAVSVAVKELVDTLPQGHHFLLTGSASVGRGTMESSDPLVGRASRLTLHPFTRLELDGPPGSSTPSLVDVLFDSPLVPVQAPSVQGSGLHRLLEAGGLPAFALPRLPRSRAAWQNQVQTDTLAILGDQVLPNEPLDVGTARAVLDTVLRTPGGQINRTRIGQELDLDARTVGRYLGILQRRFLMTLLPNLKGGVTRAARRAPKGHAVDTSSTCESLIRAGHDIASSPELTGQVLETWVVNQLLAAQGWATAATDAFYWRDNRTGKEVDLVLVDGRGRRVGVEVKLASSISLKDLQGLKAMRKDGGLHRGFVVYTGTEFEEVDDGLWALPLACLTSRRELGKASPDPVPARSPTPPTALLTPIDHEKEKVTAAPSAAPVPTVFLSYVHADNDYLEGALVKFAEEVARTCDFKGIPIDLRNDEEILQWGDRWSERLQDEVERTTFLFAMVTTRYLTSEACRKEFLQFRSKTRKAGYNGILTLLVDEPDWNLPALRDDPTAQVIHAAIEEHQWLEPETPLEDLEPDSPQFRRAAREIGRELIKRIKARNAEGPVTSTDTNLAEPSSADDADPGIVELIDTIQENHLPRLQREMDALDKVMSTFGSVMHKEFALVPQGSLPTPTQVKRIARGLEPSRQALETATSSFSEAWSALDKDVSDLVRVTGAAGVDELSDALRTSLTDLAASLELPGADDMALQLGAFARFSRALRPVAETMTRTLNVVNSIKQSASIWAETL